MAKKKVFLQKAAHAEEEEKYREDYERQVESLTSGTRR